MTRDVTPRFKEPREPRVPWSERRSRIKPVSEKRASEQEQRAEVRRIVMARDPACRAFGRAPGACKGRHDVHEILSQARGGDYLDPAGCIRVCRWHHDWLHLHPNDAVELGLLEHSWQGREPR
jgi:hypothetical protein